MLDYEGNASFIHDFPGIARIDDYGKSMEIQLEEQSDPQALLNMISGKLRVSKFEVREPTLNAIFIDKVGAKDAQDSCSH